jgi:hypothetical protein
MLRNGTMMVTGLQWPIFLYQDYKYDTEEPWDGLLHSTLLIKVCPTHFSDVVYDPPIRRSNIYLPRPVPLTKKTRLLDAVTLASTE